MIMIMIMIKIIIIGVPYSEHPDYISSIELDIELG